MEEAVVEHIGTQLFPIVNVLAFRPSSRKYPCIQALKISIGIRLR